MRKNYFLFIALLISTLSFGQTTVFQESFETGNSGTASEVCNDNDADFFTRTDGSDISSNYIITGIDGTYYFAAQDTDGAPCTSTTETLTFTGIDISGYSNLTFAILVAEDDASDGAEDWDADTNVLIEVNIDGAGYTSLIQFSGGGATNTAPGIDSDFDGTADGTLLTSTFQEFTATIGVGSTADIKITFDTLDAGDEDIAIDNIRLINNFSVSPNLAISLPSEGNVFGPLTTSVDVTLSVQNFNVANGTGDGHIVYTINGGSENDKYDASAISVPVSTGNSYSVYVELVDNSGNPLSTPVNATVNFSVASIGQVSTLTALRNGTVGQYYELTGEAVISYARSARNQKYIEDNTVAVTKSASGSGILIDDNLGIITTTYNQYDGISGLKGQLVNYNGLLEFVPLEDPGSASSTGNTITPEEVTLTELSTNWNNYESELVKIKGVTFAAGDGSAVFASSTNYDISDGGTTITFRTLFSEADYIGQLIPTGSQDIVVLVGEFNGTPQVVTRDLADMTATLGVNRNAIEGFSIFPNPVTNGKIWINTKSNTTKQVKVFDILGKQLISINLVGRELNISKLTSGIYILKVVQEGKTSTRKLVVK